MTQGLLAALAISILANLGLGWLYNSALEERATALASLTQAVSSAKECSAGVAKLEEEAKTQRLKHEAALKLAKEAAKSASVKAQKTLALSPIRVNDLCASATAVDVQKMAERRAK